MEFAAIAKPTDVTLVPTISSIMVSWTAPQFTPDNLSQLTVRDCVIMHQRQMQGV